MQELEGGEYLPLIGAQNYLLLLERSHDPTGDESQAAASLRDRAPSI